MREGGPESGEPESEFWRRDRKNPKLIFALDEIVLAHTLDEKK